MGGERAGDRLLPHAAMQRTRAGGTRPDYFFGGTGGVGGRTWGAAGGWLGLGAGVAAGFGALGFELGLLGTGCAGFAMA